MNDKAYREQKARIDKLIKKWVKPIGLGWWDMKFIYVRGEDDQPAAYEPPIAKSGQAVCIMSTQTDYYYKFATIKFFMPVIADWDDDKELERFFVHELMHIFLKPMQTRQKFSEEELVATQLAEALIWARLEGESTKATSPKI